MADYIVNGYAYPSISEETLNWWLPRLSWVASFSYGFTEDGELINLEDANLVIPANQAGVRPMMVLTPLDAQGNFNDNIAIRIFENLNARENLINNIEANIRNKNMGGVDFDFEYLAAEYADDYVRLVADTRQRLRPLGYLTTVALAPKVSTDQPGLLYQGHDYAGMGQAADYCLLMTYEWGYTYPHQRYIPSLQKVHNRLNFKHEVTFVTDASGRFCVSNFLKNRLKQ